MQKLKPSELRQKTKEELKTLVIEQRQALVFAKMQAKSGKNKGGNISLMADQLARILTVVREKELDI